MFGFGELAVLAVLFIMIFGCMGKKALFWLFAAAWSLTCFCAPIALIVVVVHFIIKYW